MIIKNPPKLASSSNIAPYLQNDLFSWMKDVATGLIRLDFKDNFQSFRVNDLTIDAGQEVRITNILPFVPSARIIVRQTGNGLVTDGVWDIQILRLINNGAVPVTISVIFFK